MLTQGLVTMIEPICLLTQTPMMYELKVLSKLQAFACNPLCGAVYTKLQMSTFIQEKYRRTDLKPSLNTANPLYEKIK